jgi:hypothetical protein
VSWSTGKGGNESRDRKGDSYNLTKEKYEHYIRIVQKNQAALKKYADSAPCNYAHQYILVEVRPSASPHFSPTKAGRWNTQLMVGCSFLHARPSSHEFKSESGMR